MEEEKLDGKKHYLGGENTGGWCIHGLLRAGW